jgi:hypothetical protein
MERVNFAEGDRLGAPEGQPTLALYVVTRGAVERRRAGYVVDESADGMGDLPAVEEPSWAPDAFGSAPTAAELAARDLARRETKGLVEVPMRIETVGEGSGLVAFGTLHALEEGRPSFATTVAVTGGVAWRLEATQLRALFDEPAVARGLAVGLASEIFRMSERYRTPLLEQPPQVVNVAAVSVAAAFESYYRAALNSFMNASLVGRAAAGTALFPNMHVQIPTRVAYINGFKATRQWLQSLSEERLASLEAKGLKVPDVERALLRFAPALLPGVFMTPLSGILEASNGKQRAHVQGARSAQILCFSKTPQPREFRPVYALKSSRHKHFFFPSLHARRSHRLYTCLGGWLVGFGSGPQQPGADGPAHVAGLGAAVLPRSDFRGGPQPAVGVVRRARAGHGGRVQADAQLPGLRHRGARCGLLFARAPQLIAAQAPAARHQLPSPLRDARQQGHRARGHARLRSVATTPLERVRDGVRALARSCRRGKTITLTHARGLLFSSSFCLLPLVRARPHSGEVLCDGERRAGA